MGLLDRLFRESRGKHLQVALDRDTVHRGEEIRVTVTVTDAERADDPLEVGIVCTETYAERQTRRSGSSGGTTSHRVMVDDVAHEEWKDADPSVPTQWFTFVVPEDAPFSYDGEHLSFAWRASARHPVRFRPDPAANVDVHVAP